jgi:flagellar protein FliO/FliZ
MACLYVAVAMLGSASASAAEKQFAAPQMTEHAPVSPAGNLLQVTVSLLLVLLAVFAAGWVVRKLRGFGKLQSDAMTVIADLPLGTKERAVLVQVGNQQLLLGVAPGRISMLHVLPEPIVRSTDVTPTSADGAPGRPDFKAILKRSLGL